jgi:hypothetical protein
LMIFFLSSPFFSFSCPLVQTKFPSRVFHTPLVRPSLHPRDTVTQL